MHKRGGGSKSFSFSIPLSLLFPASTLPLLLLLLLLLSSSSSSFFFSFLLLYFSFFFFLILIFYVCRCFLTISTTSTSLLCVRPPSIVLCYSFPPWPMLLLAGCFVCVFLFWIRSFFFLDLSSWVMMNN